ncbi:MAG TPA: uracil-DNA glycosylase family protein [Chitinophagales bacterium]|nr:uracil-DNA glycosylase family protein [Chitinophagales bacterium]
MSNSLNELKKYFYKNLFILNDQNSDINLIEDFSEADLVGVCNLCDIKGNECNLMSGFSHTSDFNKLLQKNSDVKIKPIENGNDTPIIFLLENPGKDWNLHRNFFNKTLVFPRLNYWFGKIEDYLDNKKVAKNLEIFPESSNDAYANSFIHLMKKYNLSNVLVTNSVKCKPEKEERLPKERNIECMEMFLLKEIEIFKPQIIFCFDVSNTAKNLNNLRKNHPKQFENIQIYNLYHPKARFKKRNDIKENWYKVFDKALLSVN